MFTRKLCLAIVMGSTLIGAGCSDGGGGTGTGGKVGTGGTANSGGAPGTSGGATGTTGGAPGSGGAPNSGGAPGTGGGSSTGGAPGTGGTPTGGNNAGGTSTGGRATGGAMGGAMGGAAGGAATGGKGGSAGGAMGGKGGGAGAAGGSAGAGTGTGGVAGMGMGGAQPVPPAPARVINMTPARFFPEGVAVDRNGNFYMGSMEMGEIWKGTPDNPTAAPFIAAGANGLVSPLGIYADDATNTLWVCSSDTVSGPRHGAVAIKSFNLTTGAALASYAWPAPTTMLPGTTGNGFCNDLTVDADGNVYATDSWYPRIVRLAKGGSALTVWFTDPILGTEQWHLNGIDVDQSSGNLFVIDQGQSAQSGRLFRIPIMTNGSAGAITQITFPAALKHPDGLKVIAPNLFAMGEAAGAVSLLRVTNNTGTVETVISGLRGASTLALSQASAWVLENQGDHYWDATNAGPNAAPPFRLMEIPLTVGAGKTNISITTPRFFPEGVTVDTAGNFYVGSMDLGSIQKVAAGTTTPTPFIAAGTNGLVSVIGLYAHTASNRLWVCSSDAGNGQLKGSAPVALKSFNLTTGAAVGSWAWPAASVPITGTTVNGFCNDITIDSDGNVYATDSWYPRVLRLVNGGAGAATLTEWATGGAFPTGQWHLNGIDVDAAGNNMYVVENHPGHLYRVPISPSGMAGTPVEVTTQRPLFGPDGLKVLNPTTLAIAEGSGGMAVIDLTGANTGRAKNISTGFDGVATFAMLAGSAWLVENQGDHFWNPTGPNGPTATKPFRLVETPLAP